VVAVVIAAGEATVAVAAVAAVAVAGDTEAVVAAEVVVTVRATRSSGCQIDESRSSRTRHLLDFFSPNFARRVCHAHPASHHAVNWAGRSSGCDL